MDSKHFKGHRVLLPYGAMTFWKNYAASGMAAAKVEEEWEVCEIKLHNRFTPIKEFKLEDNSQGSRDMTLHFISAYLFQLNDIFEAGRKDKAKEIRRVLEV